MNEIECTNGYSRRQNILQEGQKNNRLPLSLAALFPAPHKGWDSLALSLRPSGCHAADPLSPQPGPRTGWVGAQLGWDGEGGCRKSSFSLGTILFSNQAVLITSQLLHFNLHLVPGLVWLRIWKGGGMWLIHNNNHSPSSEPHASLSSSSE